MKFIELFAGIGGFRLGLQRVCVKDKTKMETVGQASGEEKGTRNQAGQSEQRSDRSTNRFTCVWANEIDKYAAQIYRRRFGDGELYEGDIRGVAAESIPDHELLVGGFPCQAFSIAGKRAGFLDTRGTLFFEIYRIAKIKRPRLLLLENVKGLLSHERGETFRTILNALAELGYDAEWQVLNSKDFGVPQNRERVFIVGHLRGQGGGQVFPIKKNDKQNTKHTSKTRIADFRNDEGLRVRKNGLAPTLPAHLGHMGSSNCPSDLIMVKTDVKIRRLTPTECERLQGFPDGWTEGISDTQRYKCLGNAVTVNVIRAIGVKIGESK